MTTRGSIENTSGFLVVFTFFILIKYHNFCMLQLKKYDIYNLLFRIATSKKLLNKKNRKKIKKIKF